MILIALSPPPLVLQNYDTTDAKIKRDFEQYGPVVKVC